MLAHFRRCESDEDYAQFTLFFIRNRSQFHSRFSVTDTLLHILDSLGDSHIILVVDEGDRVIGWGHYRYVTADYQADPEGEVVFINSVILAEEYRSSRTFFQGLRYLVDQIAGENSHVKQMHFYALASNAYVNRLYAKFARIIGEREGDFETENIYAADFEELFRFLHRSPLLR